MTPREVELVQLGILASHLRLQQVHGRQRRTAALADLKEATYPRGTQELTQQKHDDHEDPVDTVE